MRIEQLAFLRFIAATGVVIFHFGRGTQTLQWGLPVWDRANTAVSFFFLLSGFILAHVSGRPGIRRASDFYVARLARILPLYWLALIAVVLYRWRRGALDWHELIASVFLIQAWLPGWSQVLNAPGWSLSVEFLFYLCFPLLMSKMRNLRSWSLLLLGGAIWALNLALHVVLSRVSLVGDNPVLRDFVTYHPSTHLGTFVVGMVLGLLFKVQRHRLRIFATPMLLGSTALFLALVLIPNALVQYHHNGLFAPLFGAFVLGLSAAPQLLISRLFSWGPLVLLGESSYGMYLLQGPVFLAWTPVSRKLSLSQDAFFWSFYLILILVSVASFRWVEGPARRRIRGLVRKPSLPGEIVPSA